MQGPGGDCQSSSLSCALRFPSLWKEVPAEASVIEWWWHIWPRQAGDLGIDPSLDTNPGILCYFFPPCQFVEVPTQLENTESNEKCTRRPAETTRPLKVFGILSLGGGHWGQGERDRGRLMLAPSMRVILSPSVRIHPALVNAATEKSRLHRWT